MRLLIVFSLLVGLISSPAFALSLDDAKAAGKVGEKLNGYLGAVVSDAEVNALVTEVNAKRKDAYARIAKANKLAVAQVEKVAAEKAINKTPAGQFIETSPGQWKKK